MQRPENPFGSRFTRPGALPFLLPADNSSNDASRPSEVANPWLETLAHQVLSQPRSAIVGPHGCGKTTLLHLLLERVESKLGDHWVLTTLRIGETAKPLWDGLDKLLEKTTKQGESSAPGLLVIDGYEQLGWLGRRQLIWQLHQHAIHLLVTAHQLPSGFSTIANLQPDEAVARRLAYFLISDFPEFSDSLEPAFQSAWQIAGGNIRDVWAMLYDWFESQLHQSQSSKGPKLP